MKKASANKDNFDINKRISQSMKTPSNSRKSQLFTNFLQLRATLRIVINERSCCLDYTLPNIKVVWSTFHIIQWFMIFELANLVCFDRIHHAVPLLSGTPRLTLTLIIHAHSHHHSYLLFFKVLVQWRWPRPG